MHGNVSIKLHVCVCVCVCVLYKTIQNQLAACTYLSESIESAIYMRSPLTLYILQVQICLATHKTVRSGCVIMTTLHLRLYSLCFLSIPLWALLSVQLVRSRVVVQRPLSVEGAVISSAVQ